MWVIEGDKNILNVLPFDKLDLNVILTNDLTLYRDRKVRILNGAHTMTVLAAYLYGKDTVKECVDDELVNLYMRKGIFEEIIPTLDLPKEDLIDFANSVLERFANPFIQHYLLSISLNSLFPSSEQEYYLQYLSMQKGKEEFPKLCLFPLQP